MRKFITAQKQSSDYPQHATCTLYTDDEQVIELLREQQGLFNGSYPWLYQSETLARDGYIRSLVANLFLSYGVSERIVTPRVDVEDVKLSIDTIIPCALIINELVSNALKHAFQNTGNKGAVKGEVTVQLRHDTGSRYVLVVSDNGIGLPQGLDFENRTSLGLSVGILVKQLRAASA